MQVGDEFFVMNVLRDDRLGVLRLRQFFAWSLYMGLVIIKYDDSRPLFAFCLYSIIKLIHDDMNFVCACVVILSILFNHMCASRIGCQM